MIERRITENGSHFQVSGAQGKAIIHAIQLLSCVFTPGSLFISSEHFIRLTGRGLDVVVDWKQSFVIDLVACDTGKKVGSKKSDVLDIVEHFNVRWPFFNTHAIWTFVKIQSFATTCMEEDRNVVVAISILGMFPRL